MAERLIIMNDYQVQQPENGWVGTIKNIKDVNLKMTRGRQQYWAGGLYDFGIFGSPKRCACGRMSEVGKTCPICRVRVVDDFTYWTEYATCKLDIPFVPFIQTKALINELRKILALPDITIENDHAQNGFLWSLYLKVSNTEFDGSARFFDKNGKSVFVRLTELPDPTQMTEDDSASFAGLFGLLYLGELYDSDGVKLEKIRNLIHTQLIVSSPARRPIHWVGNILTVPEETTNYRAIISFARQARNIIGEYSIVDAMSICALFNTMVNRLYGDNELLQSSKQSLTRTVADTRVSKSFRATIVAKLYDDEGKPVPMNTLYIPWYQFYATMQHDIIRRLTDELTIENMNKEHDAIVEDAKLLMKQRDPRAIRIASELEQESMCILTRNPTLSKFSQFAFYIKTWDNPAIGLPVAVDSPYCADHDGDTVACWIYNDPKTVERLSRMTPDHIWTYDKYYECPYTFTKELMYGLYMATVIKKPTGGIKCFDTFESAEEAYKNDEIKVNELIKIGDKHTTYGRTKISNIIGGIDIDEFIAQNNGKFDKKYKDSLPALSNKYIDPRGINKSNVELFMRLLNDHPRRVQEYAEIQSFAAEVETLSGLGPVPYKELYTASNKEIQEILDDNNYDQSLTTYEIAMLKREKLTALFKKSVEQNVDSIPDSNIRELMVSAGGASVEKLMQVYCPSINGETNESLTAFNEDSLFDGISEQSYVSAASHDRGTLKLKQDNVPSSGFVQRQLNDACWNTIYHANEDSPDTTGIIMKGDSVVGRIDIYTGKEFKKPTDHFVRVKSCVTNGKPNVVYHDEIAQYKYNVEDKSSIGASFASALVEPITQAGLALKHGGAINSLLTTYVSSFEAGIVTEVSDRFIIVEGKHKYRYLITECCIVLANIVEGTEVEEGTKLLVRYQHKKTDYSISMMTTILQAQVAGDTGKPFKRNLSYTVTTGKVKYSDSYVAIGDINYPISEEDIYLYPDGYDLKEVGRIATGVPNLNQLSTLTDDIGILYYIFYDFVTSVFNGFNTEPLELIFKNIMYANFSLKTALYTNGSLIDRLYYGNAVKNFSTAITEAVAQAQIPENQEVIDKMDIDEAVRVELNKRKLSTNRPTEEIVEKLHRSEGRSTYNSDFIKVIEFVTNGENGGSADWESIRSYLSEETDRYNNMTTTEFKDSIIDWINSDLYASKLLPYITINRNGISVKMIDRVVSGTNSGVNPRTPQIDLGNSIVAGIIMKKTK